jgi:ribonuclease HI
VGFDSRALKIYIDGNCWKNPGGPGGTAARVEFPLDWDRADELVDYRGFFDTNNQRMELRACIFAHEWVLENAEDLGIGRVQIFTDSMYVYEGYRWMIGWSQRDYCSSDGRPIKNDPLWRDLMRLRKKLRILVDVYWVQGKSTPATKQVDKDAKAAGLSPAHVDHGFKTGKIGRSKNAVKKGARLYPAAGQVTIFRVYQSVAARRGIELFKVQEFDEGRKDFFNKFDVYVDAAIGCELHRQHCYCVRMNDVPRYPGILEIIEEVDEDAICGVGLVSAP